MFIKPTSLTVTQLLTNATERYVIPTYQRRYSWHERQVWDLIDDIKLIEGGDTHLLGSIVCLTEDHDAEMNRLELVDGQQRLTTIAILLQCLRERLNKDGDPAAAAEVERLLIARPLKGKSIRKLALDSIDAHEFEKLCSGEIPDATFKNHNLAAAFKIVREWVAEQSPETVRVFLHRLVNQAVLIRLDVSKAKDAFKLFETINNRGLRLSPTDIIKNFLLGNAARFGSDSLDLARSSWASLISHLDGVNADGFFRYYAMTLVQTRVQKHEVVATLKAAFMRQVSEAASLPERHLYPEDESEEDAEPSEASDEPATELVVNGTERVSFKKFLTRLVSSAMTYGELVLAKTGNPQIDRRLRNLAMIKAVQTYGFLTYLRVGGCSDAVFLEVLKLTEAFVLRRHVCQERANETEALFARLCSINSKDPVTETRRSYGDLCPSDDVFGREFANTNFTYTVINRARYCLEQIELKRRGQHQELQVLGADAVHVEHIIPLKIKSKSTKKEFGDWVAYLGSGAEGHHPKYVSRIGNLTLFAGELNIKASNNPFKSKKEAYKKSSIAITQELASMHSFRFKHVDARSKELAMEAVNLWPRP